MTSVTAQASSNMSEASAELACENIPLHRHETEKPKREAAPRLTPTLISQGKTSRLKTCAAEAGSRCAPPSPAKQHVRC